jgi:thymidine phosphorylase
MAPDERKRTTSLIMPGISNLAKIGDRVEPGQRLLTLHANDAFKMEDAERLVAQAFTYADDPVPHRTLVTEQIG